MRKQLSRMIACILTVAMVLTMMPDIAVRAEGAGETNGNSLKFSASDLEHVSLSYRIAEEEPVQVDAQAADAGGAIWVFDIPENADVTIEAVPVDGYQLREVSVNEGEEQGAPSAFNTNGAWNEQKTSYIVTFPAQNRGPYVVVIEEETSQGPGPGPEGPGGEGPGPGNVSWEDTFNPVLGVGLNFISQWIGNCEGDVTYEFADSIEGFAASQESIHVLSRDTWQDCLNTVANATEEERLSEAYKQAYQTAFQIPLGARYVRLTAGEDFGGNHIGFELYQIKEARIERVDDVQIPFYDYRTGEWLDVRGDNRNWEDYLKCLPDPVDGQDVETQGLILDLNTLYENMDAEEPYALRCNLPFDNRKNLGWWNGKYKEQVEAAGDRIAEDNWVYNGAVELVSVKSETPREDGTEIVYYSNDPEWQPDPSLDANMVVVLGKAGYDFDGYIREKYENGNEKFTKEEMLEAAQLASGECLVPFGAVVTIKLIPDAGYQILAANLNGMPLTPDVNEQSQFTFKMTSNLHLQALFEETKDIVSVEEAAVVSDAQITGTEQVIDNGNLALTVTDDKDYDTSKALAKADGTVLAAMDIAVDQVIAKAGNLSEQEQEQAKEGKLKVTEEKYWKNNLTELNNEVDIALNLDSVSVQEGESLTVVRDHEGACETIPCDIKTENGKTVLHFASDKFSTYTIVKTGTPKKEEHKHVTKVVPAVLAAMNTDGNIAYYTCSCGKLFADAAAAKEITKAETVVSGIKSVSIAAVEKGAKAKVEVKDTKDNLISADQYTVGKISTSKYGTASVTVTFQGRYTGTSKVKYTVVPKKPKLSGKVKKTTSTITLNVTVPKNLKVEAKLFDAKGKALSAKKIKINKKSNTKYEIKITKLAKKKVYNIKVRTYVKEKKKTYASEWLLVSKVKTK